MGRMNHLTVVCQHDLGDIINLLHINLSFFLVCVNPLEKHVLERANETFGEMGVPSCFIVLDFFVLEKIDKILVLRLPSSSE